MNRSELAASRTARAAPGTALVGAIRPPGDKSVSHRALLFGALAQGETQISGLLEGDDVLRTAAAARALGAELDRLGPGSWRVIGRSRLAQPDAALDFGNSGTGCRLVMGAVAGAPIQAEFIGDPSLSQRPMGRVLDPLAAMGASVSSQGGRLPARVEGRARLQPIAWRNDAASAQVKSAVLLAGLSADGVTEVFEPVLSREHTERMLAQFGVETISEKTAEGWRHAIAGGQRLRACDVAAPGDPSSAAFLVAAALIARGSRVRIEGVLDLATRSYGVRALAAMADGVEIVERGADLIDVVVNDAAIVRPCVTESDKAPWYIDEVPILAAAAAFADGVTRFDGVGELRVKESDRIAATVAMLRANGVEAEAHADGLSVAGRGAAGVAGGGRVLTHGDHRIAMSALVLGLGAQAPVEIDDAAMIATSYPSFFADLRSLGADIEERSA